MRAESVGCSLRPDLLEGGTQARKEESMAMTGEKSDRSGTSQTKDKDRPQGSLDQSR